MSATTTSAAKVHADTPCAACGATRWATQDVLWPALVAAWGLDARETALIDRQQGMHCLACGNNLRMVSLAAAIVRSQGFEGTLEAFCQPSRSLRVLEINTAGFLTQFLRRLPGHRLVEFPAFDMTDLALDDASYDLVVHSDSLEHVPDPVRGLAECRRVLGPGGTCLFTVPMVPGRLSRSREGLPPIHHGQASTATDDQLVRTEFGADAWRPVLEAGFASCEIYAYDYPAALVMVARKEGRAA